MDDASSVSDSEFSTTASQGSKGSNFWSLSAGIAAELAGLPGIARLDTVGEGDADAEAGDDTGDDGQDPEPNFAPAAGGRDATAAAAPAPAGGAPLPSPTSHAVQLSEALRTVMSGHAFFLFLLHRPTLVREERPSMARAYFELRALCQEHARDGAPPAIFCELGAPPPGAPPWVRSTAAVTCNVKLPGGAKLKTVCTSSSQMEAERQAIVGALAQLRQHVQRAGAKQRGGRGGALAPPPGRPVVIVTKSGDAPQAQRLREALEAQTRRAEAAERRLEGLLKRVEGGGGGGGGAGASGGSGSSNGSAVPTATPRWSDVREGPPGGWGAPPPRRWGDPREIQAWGPGGGRAQSAGALGRGWGAGGGAEGGGERRLRSRSREREKRPSSGWEGAPPECGAEAGWRWDGERWVQR
jgi:hypothetical protein